MATLEVRGRILRLGLTTAAFGAAFLLLVTSAGASDPLAPSTFEGGDGNLVVDTSGDTDWANVAGLHVGVDQPSGSTDNAFGQGTKEDDPAVTVVSGSIPKNKSDLTRLYVAVDHVGGKDFLYLAWERSNVLGSANMDFEINQNATAGLTGTFSGAIMLNRTAGDLLVTYDFTQGGTKPTLGLLTWLTAAHGDSVSDCFSSNSLPCWGKHTDLTTANSEGGINAGTVTDPIPPNAPRSLPGMTFGEAVINLTDTGVFPPQSCESFGSVFLKSRASASFGAEVKDFVAPVPVSISNCPSLTITKTADAASVSAGQAIGFTVTVTNSGLADATGVTITDSLPSGTGISWSIDANTPSGSCLITGSAMLSCGPVTLAANGGSLSVHVTSATSFTSCGSYNNTATFKSTNAGSGSASASVTVQCPSLSVTKTADSRTVGTGDKIGFTIKVSNAGPGTAKNVTLNDPLPGGSGVNWSVDSQPGQGTCSIGGSPPSQTLTCSLGDLSAGASASVHVASTTSGASVGTYPNTATARADNHPPVPGSDTITVVAPSLTVTKTADAGTVNAGDQIGFRIVVKNTSPTATATGVTLSDSLPSGGGISWSVDAANSDSGCSIVAGPALSCTFGSIGPNASKQVHITSPTTAVSCGTYNNTATATADNNGSGTSQQASITVRCPSLTVAKTADTGTVNAGDAIGFTISVSNSSAAGTGTAKSVTLSDPLPVGSGVNWSIDSLPSQGNCSIAPDARPGQTLSCTFGDLSAGASVSVHVRSATAFATCGMYLNTATVSASNIPAPITKDASITVQCPSLSATKTADKATVTAGNPIGFTITVSNAGPGTAKNVTLNDPLPSGAGVSWSIDSPPSQGNCSIGGAAPNQTLTCALSDLIAGASVSVHISSATSAASAGTYPNTTTARADNQPPVMGSDTITVQALVSITSAQHLTPRDGATVTGNNPTGNVVFQLFGPDDTSCSGTPVYSTTQMLSSGSAKTPDNTIDTGTFGAGTYRWQVHYEGDGSNKPSDSACGVESVTITNG